jgi:hypothetical protein
MEGRRLALCNRFGGREVAGVQWGLPGGEL